MSERISCLVPFCRRTTKRIAAWDEWICGNHWRAVDPKLKAIKRAAKRMRRSKLAGLIWERCRRQAIERAAGLQ